MLQMAQMPVGYQYIVFTLPDGTWALRYGGPEMERMVQDYGRDIMMIPSLCVTLAPEWLELLHGQDHWSSSSWPFLMLSRGSKVAVIPFECVDDGTIEPVVSIIPRGFDTPAYLPGINGLLNVMRLAGSRVTVRHYGNCTHILMEKATVEMVIDFVTYLMNQNCPLLITTAK